MPIIKKEYVTIVDADEKGISKNRKLAIDIIGIFEDLLLDYGIYIPDNARDENNEDEACIYGSTYYELEDKIVELIDAFIQNNN